MRALPYIAFFLSGASSLVFQALWTRMLHHTFGATSVAMSTVLTAFMSGLGLGAYLFGKRAARLAAPLAVYALAELGVAACALALPPLVRVDGPLALLNAALREALGEQSHAFMLARFVCVWPLLLVPTTLMGGTLPLLTQHFVRAAEGAGTAQVRVGALYAVNTFGAVAGTLLASFVLMPALGVHATNLVAIGINAALGLGLLCLPRLGAPATPPARAAIPTPLGRRQRIALAAFGVSGACAMTYEVVWSRALAMAIGSSLQSFALILVTLLIGIAGGSAVAAHVLGPSPSRGLQLYALLGTALSLLALAPALVLSATPLAALAGLALACGVLLLVSHVVRARVRGLVEAREDELDELADDGARQLERAATRCLLVPASIAAFETVRFAALHKHGDAVAQHGYLPYVTCASVLAAALCLALVSALRHHPSLLAAGVQLAIALASFASYAFQDEIPYGFARLVSAVDDLPTHVGLVRFFMLLTAGLCTLPAALGMGAMFPVTLSLCATREDALAADVGRVYAANTLGSIVGAWLPGFVLMPLFGMARTLFAGMALNALLALALLVTECGGSLPVRRARRALSFAALALVSLLGLESVRPSALFAWNLAHMTLGAFRVALARDVLDTKRWGEPELLYYRDGVSTTVSVERWKRHLMLKNNGKVDASNGDDMPTQIMVGAYPLLLHRRGARGLDVAVVGFGSGVTVGSVLAFPVASVHVVELEDAVVDAASRHFAEVSHLERREARFPYVRAPRLTLHHDDGRNFLAATRARYDVIISEPSNPWITGVSDLFTVEHFAVAKRRLAPDGVYCQWVQLYELSPENIKTVYRTFATQFRHVLAFSADERSSDTILLGSDTPLPLDLTAVARALDDPPVGTELQRAAVHTAHDVFSRILFASRNELLAFSRTELRRTRGTLIPVMQATGSGPCAPPDCRREPVPLNTDDNMLIELRAPADLIGFARYEGYLELFYGHDWPYGHLDERLVHADDDAARAALACSLLAHGRLRRARATAQRVRDSSDPVVRRDVAAVALLVGDAPEPDFTLAPTQLAVPSHTLDGPRFAAIRAEAEAAYERGEYGRSATLLEQLPLPLRTLAGPDLHARYGLALYRSAEGDTGRMRRAARTLEALLRRDPTYAGVHPELRYFLARALLGGHRYESAVSQMRAYAASANASIPRAVAERP